MILKSILNIFKESKNHFEGEETSEEVVLLIRRHPFFILIRLFFFFILVLIPIAIISIFPSFIYSHKILNLFLFASSVWYLFIWSGIFYALTMYTLDVWIVTNHRIIDSTQHGFFDRRVSELHLIRIQDISVQTQGVIQTVFHFGDLQVQTAGAEEKFKFSQIPNPVKVKDEIMRLASASIPAHL